MMKLRKCGQWHGDVSCTACDREVELARLHEENAMLRALSAQCAEDREMLANENLRLRVAATDAADGIDADAVEIRNSWADFDGRENLRTVRLWLEPLRAILGPEKEAFDPTNGEGCGICGLGHKVEQCPSRLAPEVE
jgi:hypothetical protein